MKILELKRAAEGKGFTAMVIDHSTGAVEWPDLSVHTRDFWRRYARACGYKLREVRGVAGETRGGQIDLSSPDRFGWR